MTFIASESTEVDPQEEEYYAPAPAVTLETLLGNASVGTLLDARAKLENMLTDRVSKEYESMKESVLAIAKATNVPAEQVIEILLPKTKGKRTKVASDDKPERVKYRHPENPELTWSGRGREPKWLAEAREVFDENDLLADDFQRID